MASSRKLTSITGINEPDDNKASKSKESESSMSPTPLPQQIVVKQGGSWQTTALLFLSLLLMTTVGIAFYAFHRVGELNSQMSQTMGRVEQKLQNLDAGISFDSKRQQLLLGIRDEIMKTNPRVSLNESYEYASLIMRASDKYPSVDPLMFLAIGIVESGYDSAATSQVNARGLYQIWPSTGRLLARSLDWEYSDEMLYDPTTNTEMAALYLDILFSAYNDERMVLAEYNGGPLNAGYLRAGSVQAAAETRNYVEKVDGEYQRLRNQFKLGVDVRLQDIHKNKDRDGKNLGARRRARTATSPAADDSAASIGLGQ